MDVGLFSLSFRPHVSPLQALAMAIAILHQPHPELKHFMIVINPLHFMVVHSLYVIPLTSTLYYFALLSSTEVHNNVGTKKSLEVDGRQQGSYLSSNPVTHHILYSLTCIHLVADHLLPCMTGQLAVKNI